MAKNSVGKVDNNSMQSSEKAKWTAIYLYMGTGIFFIGYIIVTVSLGWEWPWITEGEVLHQAAHLGDIDRAARVILNSRQKDIVDYRNGLNMTALGTATQSGHHEFIKFMLGMQADVDAKTTMGWTPLMLAARHGDTDMVHTLMEWKADVNSASHTNKITSLMLAANLGHLTTVEALSSSKRIRLQARDTSGQTALDLAVAGGHDAVAQFLRDAIELRRGTTSGSNKLKGGGGGGGATGGSPATPSSRPGSSKSGSVDHIPPPPDAVAGSRGRGARPGRPKGRDDEL